MAHSPHLNLDENRRDKLLVLVYLIVVPMMILVIVIIAAFQTRDARNEVKKTADEARVVAEHTCRQTNQRDRILTRMIHLGASLTRSVRTDLTAEQQATIAKIESLADSLRPQDCTPFG